MKILIISLGLLFSAVVGAEIWEKPKYTPDEGHLQEEIERQEERPESEDSMDKKHQDVQTPDSNPSFDEEIPEDIDSDKN